MATDLERLVVQLSADIKKYENAMNRAVGVTNKQMGAIENRVRRANKSISASFAGGFGKGALGAFAAAGSLKGAQSLIDASTRISNALKVAGLSGQELNKVYDSLFASAQRNAAPIEDLVTLYGRAAQSAKDLGVNQAELLKFTDNVALSLRVGGKSAEESSGALLQLSQALGNGVVQAEEYNSLLDGAQPLLQAVAAGLKEAGGSVSALTRLVKDGKVSSEAFFRAFEAGAVILEDKVGGSQLTVSQGLTRLQNILIDTAREFDNNSDAASLLAQMIDKMGKAMSESAAIITTLIGPLQTLHEWVSSVTDAALEMSAAFGAATGLDEIGRSTGASPYRSQRQIQDRINNAFGSTATESKPGTTADITGGKTIRPVTLADYKVPAKEKKTGSKSKGVPRTAESRFNDDIQSIRDRTEALRQETELVGKSYEEQEKRKMALELEQSALADLREEARKKGETDLNNIKLSSEQISQIDAISAAYARQADELRNVQEAQDRAEQAATELYDSFKSGVMDAITGAESLSDALSGILKKLGEMLFNNALDALFAPQTSNSSGGAFGGIFGGLGKMIGFDRGGYTGKGGKYQPAGIVHKGEFVMDAAATKRIGVDNLRKLQGYASGGLVGSAPRMPNLQSIAGGNGGVNVTYAPQNNFQGTSEELAQFRREQLKDKQEFSARVVDTVRRAQKTRNL